MVRSRARCVICWFCLACVWLARPLGAVTLPFTGFPKLEVSGNSSMSLNYNNVTGQESTYQNDYVGRDQPVSHTSNLYITGELLRDLYLNATIVDDLFSPDRTRWNLRYDGRYAKVLVGDFTANLAGNQFVLLNRTLQGVQVDAGLPKGSLTFITSTLTSPVHTQTFPGGNVSGPYYLEATPIVDGSEAISINGERKTRMTDYTLDYTNGILNFTSGLIVSPSDTITASYEVNGNGTSGGQLYAVRAAYPVLPKLNIGVSYLALDTPTVATTTTKQWTEQFVGNGGRGPFYLSNRPVLTDGSEVVTVNSILWADLTTNAKWYTLDTATGGILFDAGKEPPPGSTITVKYTQRIDNAAGNDRAVGGVDVNWQPWKRVTLSMEAATSKPTTDTQALSGRDALAITGTYSDPKLSANVHYRNVDEGFTPLDMVGFSQALRGMDWSGQYHPIPLLTFNVSGSDTREPNAYTLASVTKIYMDTQNLTYSVALQKEHWPSLTLRRTTNDAAQSGGSTYHNAATTDSAALTYTFHTLTTGFNISHTLNDSTTPTGTDNTSVYAYHGDTLNGSLNLSFQPSERLNLSSVLSMNIVDSGTDTKTTTHGNSMQVNGSFLATPKLTFTGNVNINTTGATKDAQGNAVPALVSRTYTVGADWRLRKELSFGATYTTDAYEGSGYSNSTGNTITLNSLWSPLPILSFSGNWNRQTLEYTDASGSSENNMVGASVSLGPVKKVTATMDSQYIWGSSAASVTQLSDTAGLAIRTVRIVTATGTAQTITGNRLLTLASKVSYPIFIRTSLFVQGESAHSSGYPSESQKYSYGLGIDYKVSDNLTLTVDGTRVDYKDYANASLDYAATQGDAQLNWAF